MQNPGAEAETNATYRAIFEQSPDAVVVFDTALRVTDCNEAFARLIQSSRDRIIGVSVDDLNDQSPRDALNGALAGRVVNHTALYEATTSSVRLWLTGTYSPLRDGAGRIRGVIAVLHERTQQALTETALHESEQRYRRLVDHLPEPVIVHIDESIVYANSAAARLLGAADPEALIGRSVVDLVESPLREATRKRIRLVARNRQAVGRVEQRYLRLDGHGTVDAEVTAIPFTFDGRPAVLCLGRDVTDRKRLEERLIDAEKMEAVGQLASRVAHDFNNLLTVIGGNAELLLKEPRDATNVVASAHEIREGVLRGSALVRQLRFSSRREAQRPTYMELNAIVRREERLLRRLLGDVQLRLALAPDAGTVYVDPHQLGQVLVNLAVNARDAMPEGGTVTIETDALRVGASGRSRWHELAPGAYATLTVHDTGIGMDEVTKARIFEPFFTPKGPDGGTGLGLSIVADIVRESGGTIRTESRPLGGSSFVIYWPVAERSAAAGDRP